MKKLLLSFLTVVLLCSNYTYINAYQDDEISKQEANSFSLSTNEPTMPLLDSNELSTYNTRAQNSRSIWIEQVKKISEESYNQTVNNVIETEEYIIFEFNDNHEKEKDIVVTNGNEFSNVQIISVSYLKPEAINNSNSMKGVMTTRDSSVSTKIIEYYGWSSGYKEYKKKSGTFNNIASLAIAYVPTKNVLVSWVIEQAMGTLYNSLTGADYVTAQTLNKYYYRNKIGCVYAMNQWLSIVQIGQRRSFGWEWASAPNADDEPIVYKNTPKNANNSRNPSNYDGSIEYKSHYNDNSWITNKTIETMNSGGYVDVYSIVLNPY